jgi:S-DNA-T family DNA segregation ATPase FtsK/SpoIIIE
MLVEALQGTRLLLGLVDLPDRQIQQELELDLAEGGGWLATGGPRSGRTTLLRTVLSEAVRRLAPADLHVHVLDPSGGTLATEAAGVPHTGTTISGADPLRTARLIDRLAAEVAARRAGPPDRCRPLILVLVDGVEAVSGQLDDVDPTGGTATLLRLMRDGAAVGVTCVLTADRAVPGGRLAAAVRQRLVLPLPDRADYAVAGVPARAVPSRRPPGRALVGEDGLECQLALPAPLPVRTDPAPSDPERPARLRIAELPPDPALDLPDAGRLPPERSGPLMLSIGPGGDEGESVNVDLLQTGGLLVTGPPGSGRSSALAAFALHLRAAGMPVLWIGRPPVDPYPANGPDARVPDDGSAWDQIGLDPHDDSGTTRWLADRTGTPCVVIADEVGAPAEVPALMALPVLGRNTGVTLVAAGTAGQFTAHYQGPVAHLRRARSGLLLCPGPGDADLLGIRLPRVQLPVRPGSGWLATRGRVERVQVARRRAPALVSVRNPAAMDLARG